MTDATELATKLNDAVEALEVAIIDGIDGTVDDRLRLFALLGSLNWSNGRITAITASVEESLAGDLDGPTEVDGQTWMSKRIPKRTGFDRPALRDAVTRWAARPRLDVSTGELVEPERREVIADIWVLADVATGRTAKLRDADIDLDEYAHTEWETRVKAIDPRTIRPDQ